MCLSCSADKPSTRWLLMPPLHPTPLHPTGSSPQASYQLKSLLHPTGSSLEPACQRPTMPPSILRSHPVELESSASAVPSEGSRPELGNDGIHLHASRHAQLVANAFFECCRHQPGTSLPEADDAASILRSHPVELQSSASAVPSEGSRPELGNEGSHPHASQRAQLVADASFACRRQQPRTNLPEADDAASILRSPPVELEPSASAVPSGGSRPELGNKRIQPT